MRNELINVLFIINLLLYKWRIVHIGTQDRPWHGEVLCEDTLLLSPTSSLPWARKK